jgi:hypothetical protein
VEKRFAKNWRTSVAMIENQPLDRREPSKFGSADKPKPIK